MIKPMSRTAILKREREAKKELKRLQSNFRELMKAQSLASKKESRRTHFKIIAGSIICNFLNLDLDFYAALPRPDKRKKGEQPEHPDQIFEKEIREKMSQIPGLNAGLPPE